MNINRITKDYNKGYLTDVRIELASMKSSDRIDFEKWLLDRFSPDKALDSDWMHQRIIEELCRCTIEDTDSAPDTKKQEDLLIAKLISKAMPEKKKDSLSSIAHRVRRSADMILNTLPIFLAIKDAPLPHTCAILLKKMLEHQTLEAIFDQAVIDRNPALIKTIVDQMPFQFSRLLMRKDKDGWTFFT